MHTQKVFPMKCSSKKWEGRLKRAGSFRGQSLMERYMYMGIFRQVGAKHAWVFYSCGKGIPEICVIVCSGTVHTP